MIGFGDGSESNNHIIIIIIILLFIIIIIIIVLNPSVARPSCFGFSLKINPLGLILPTQTQTINYSSTQSPSTPYSVINTRLASWSGTWYLFWINASSIHLSSRDSWYQMGPGYYGNAAMTVTEFHEIQKKKREHYRPRGSPSTSWEICGLQDPLFSGCGGYPLPRHIQSLFTIHHWFYGPLAVFR